MGIGLIGVRYKRSLERARDTLLEVSFTEVVIETMEAAEITADRQEHNPREDPPLSGRIRKWRRWKKKGV